MEAGNGFLAQRRRVERLKRVRAFVCGMLCMAEREQVVQGAVEC